MCCLLLVDEDLCLGHKIHVIMASFFLFIFSAILFNVWGVYNHFIQPCLNCNMKWNYWVCTCNISLILFLVLLNFKWKFVVDLGSLVLLKFWNCYFGFKSNLDKFKFARKFCLCLIFEVMRALNHFAKWSLAFLLKTCFSPLHLCSASIWYSIKCFWVGLTKVKFKSLKIGTGSNVMGLNLGPRTPHMFGLESRFVA